MRNSNLLKLDKQRRLWEKMAPEQMYVELSDESGFRLQRLVACDQLSVRILPNGCLYAIEHREILISQLLGSPLAGGGHRIYLRAGDGASMRFTELVGPRAPSALSWSRDRCVWSGSWCGLRYQCTLWLHPGAGAWFFHVEVENQGGEAIPCDAVLVQDLGLATRAQVRNNEIFNSQYLDHFALEHPEVGWLLMSRQNLPQSTGAADGAHPWLLQGCFPAARGFASDGFDIFGSGHRGDGLPAALSRPLIGERVRQYECSLTAVQSSRVELKPSASQAWTFFAHFLPDHPAASSAADADRLQRVRVMRADLSSALAAPVELIPQRPPRSIFQTAELFPAGELDETDVGRLFPGQRRHEERRDGRLLSFFHGDDARHVVLKAKETLVPRPHGHILRAGPGMLPAAELMCCTCYAAGVFASHVTVGNASLARLLSGVRDPLNLVRCGGLRIFVRRNAADEWQLLGVPSAFEMARECCRWHYQCGDLELSVCGVASDQDPAFTLEVQASQPLELLICGEVAAGAAEYESSPRLSIDGSGGRISVRPDERCLLGRLEPGLEFRIVASQADAVAAVGADELLFPDRQRRGYPYFSIQTRPTRSFGLTLLGTRGGSAQADALAEKYQARQPGSARWPDDAVHDFWPGLTRRVRVNLPLRDEADQLQDALAWFARDAMVHLSTPRGLEQAGGGAWGIRDVCQGAVEFLLSYDHREIVAQILLRVFAQQYRRRGDWPQWFMFPPFEQIQSRHCHGDNLIWPLKALCDYLEHANDGSILHERVAYTDDETLRATDRIETVLEHCDRLLDALRCDLLPGVALPKYGEGDWDDSLQPADPLLRERMVSSWTAALMYQTLRRYAAALTVFGEGGRAATAEALAEAIRADFQRYLMPDGIVAGFAVFDGERPRPVEYLLHPSDGRTGIHYRLIPMTRGILSGIFTPEQANRHLELIHQHLLFPDGARLMDRPSEYRGGVERTFRRAESAAFFGREIGLQYVHAHLRYAEALAMMGRAEDLWRALRVVNPITVTDLVPGARARQRNCYFSSSDAAFDDRYQAARQYDKLRRGEVPTDGGWRIYSSGPGIYTSLVIRHLFGLRRHFGSMELDPVLPRVLDGCSIDLQQNGRRVRYEFAVRGNGCGPRRVAINGVAFTSFTPVAHAYRKGGVGIAHTELEALLTLPQNVVRIE